MNKLIKIRDVSIKYDVLVCTLRYYEGLGYHQMNLYAPIKLKENK